LSGTRHDNLAFSCRSIEIVQSLGLAPILGANGYMNKPAQPQALLQAIRTVLGIGEPL
jgi:DNA-binding NarL/FixJ family response regulator